MKTILTGEARAARIEKIVTAEFGKGTSLPETRRILSKDAKLGGAPSLYLGTADPIYYRLAGTARPLSLPKGAKSETKDGAASSALATAVRKRRDEGVRWETLAASTAALLGRPVSIPEARRLYEKGKGDLESSYVGKGTRRGAPATYADLATTAEAVAGS